MRLYGAAVIADDTFTESEGGYQSHRYKNYSWAVIYRGEKMQSKIYLIIFRKNCEKSPANFISALLPVNSARLN